MFGRLGVVVLVLTLTVTTSQAAEYPPDPETPDSATACYSVARNYSAMRQELLRAFDALGMGKGRHVQSGPCCLQESGGSKAWCSMFASHAAQWEAIACLDIEKAAALDRCLTKVRQLRKSKKSTEAPEREKLWKAALTGIKVRDWYNIAMRWKDSGNDPVLLKDTVEAASTEAVDAAMHDPLIREVVKENLKDIGATLSKAQSLLDSSFEQMSRDFPNAASDDLIQSVSASGANSGSSTEREACINSVRTKIASCMNSAFADPNRESDDFGYIIQCKNKYKSERVACGE